MQEKLILVFYIPVGGLSSEEMYENMTKINHQLLIDKEEDVHYYIVPTHDIDCRIECINPKLVTEEEYKDVRKKLEDTKSKLDDVCKLLMDFTNKIE